MTRGERRAFDLLPRWLVRAGLAAWLAVGIVVALVLLVMFVAVAADVTVPVAVALFLAAGLIPFVDALERRGVGRAVGSAIVLSGLVLAGVAAVWLTVVAVSSQQAAIAVRLDQAQTKVVAWFDSLDSTTVDQVRSGFGDVAASGGFGGAVRGLLSFASSGVALVAGVLFALVVLYYALKDGHRMTAWLVRRRGRADDRTLRVVRDAAQTVQHYGAGNAVLAAIQAVAIGGAAWAMGVPLAGTIAVVNFIGAFVPYLGAFVGGAVAVLLALSTGGLPLAAATLVVVLLVNVVLENALQPRLLGSALDLHPLTVLIVTVFGGLVAGVVGLVLAAPAAAIFRSVYREVRSSGFFDDDDDGRASPAPSPPEPPR
jgi:predicted PurR-regulated permease PerM